jgi:alpha-glucosidase
MDSFYPEPPVRCANLSWDKETSTFTGNDGSVLHVRYLQNTAWELVITHAGETPVHHPFTGGQDQLHTSGLHQTGDSDIVTLKPMNNNEELSVTCSSGAIRFSHDSHSIIEADAPFASHAEPQNIYEGVMSLKITDFSDRSPFGPIGTLYPTRMVRFQYKKPSGPILGLPGQAGEMNRDGYRFQLYNTDTFMHTPDRPPMYQSWPILFHRDVSGNGWTCIFHDNPSRTFVDVGDFYPDTITFESQSGPSRIYVLHGSTLLEVSEKLSRLLGGCKMPPEWAFGYQQCRWSYMSTDEIRDVAKKMREEEIPCSALYFDIDYMDEFRVFTHHRERFHDLHICLEDLKKLGIHSVCIVDPGMKIDDKNDAYKKILESGKILRTVDGDPFVGSIWPGKSVFPDYKEEGMQELWSDLQKEWLQLFPFDGVWNDMNEPSNFDGQNKVTSQALHADGSSVRDDWNLYGYHMARASRRGMEKAGNPDGLVITRSGYPGVQQYAVVWHGDNQAWWEHMRLAIDTAITYSLCGAFYTGPDVPGFTGNPPDDLAIRFFQLGAWLPLFRGHSIYFSKDKEPYAFAPKTAAIIKRAIRERTAMQQEWVDAFKKACAEHQSPMMPVFTDKGHIARDQFLLFDRYLVAPVTERDQEIRSIYLPEGSWKRLHDDSRTVTGNQWITEQLTLESIPVFVRA